MAKKEFNANITSKWIGASSWGSVVSKNIQKLDRGKSLAPPCATKDDALYFEWFTEAWH